MTPKQKPGKSKQDYQTPPELLRAIERDFHVTRWELDLAAHARNAVCERWYGPGGIAENSFEADWKLSGDLWLNQPFEDIPPWVSKSAHTVRQGRIFQLAPASVGSNWYVGMVHGRAHVVSVSPRVTFVGCEDPYPKDLVLMVWGAVKGGFSTWRWK